LWTASLKKTRRYSQTKKNQNLIDADSELTHVSESIARNEFCFRASLPQIWGEAAMYYGFYLFGIAILVMIGQLAFALYQVASLVASWAKIRPCAQGRTAWFRPRVLGGVWLKYLHMAVAIDTILYSKAGIGGDHEAIARWGNYNVGAHAVCPDNRSLLVVILRGACEHFPATEKSKKDNLLPGPLPRPDPEYQNFRLSIGRSERIWTSDP
jgi:hypothetical protein